MSGVHVTSYWVSALAWDLINALIPVTLTIIMFAVFQLDAYTGDGLLAVVILFVSWFCPNCGFVCLWCFVVHLCPCDWPLVIVFLLVYVLCLCVFSFLQAGVGAVYAACNMDTCTYIVVLMPL